MKGLTDNTSQKSEISDFLEIVQTSKASKLNEYKT